MTTTFLSEPATLDVAFGDEYVHIKFKGREACVCGFGPGPTRHRFHEWTVMWEECSCGARVCPACQDIYRTYERSGSQEFVL